MPRLPTFALTFLLSALLGGAAAAQPAPPLAPPGGPVRPAGPDDTARPRGPGDRPGRDARAGDRQGRLPPALRQLLLARFDRDHDGRLTGRERQQAKRFVKRHRRQLRQTMGEGGQGQRGQGQRGQGPRGQGRGGQGRGGQGQGAMGPGGL
ncbi:MAG: hypothetical protein IPL61_35355 [Myxococcales bacterium]|nr:hypothetical protein [Myxococcales bacterium]